MRSVNAAILPKTPKIAEILGAARDNSQCALPGVRCRTNPGHSEPRYRFSAAFAAARQSFFVSDLAELGPRPMFEPTRCPALSAFSGPITASRT